MAQIKTNILNQTVVGDVVKGDPSSGIQYYPDDDELNHWMLAMIGIGLVFITFVGVSIYLMCKSNNQEGSDRNPKAERSR